METLCEKIEIVISAVFYDGSISLNKKWSFPLKISSVNATKSVGSYRFG